VLVAAAWALHPAAVEAVAPVSGRSVPLSSALLLAALLLSTRRQAPRGATFALAAAAALAAPLVRETTLVLPALVALWCATFGAGESGRQRLRRLAPAAGGAALAAVALALSARQRELIAFSLAERDAGEALRGNLYALFEILRLWIVPQAISIDPALPVEAPWSAAATLARLGALVAAGLFAVAARRRWPLATFAVGWTLLTLAPGNSVIWRLDPVAPRALYLASLGPLLLVAGGLARLLAAPAERRVRRPLAALAVALALFAITASAGLARHRSALYADPVALWADAAAKAPAKARPHSNLGTELLLAERLDEAEVAFRRALELDPGAEAARCALDAIRIRRLSDPPHARPLPGGAV
jgi:protein O-mannosyl-transferase